MKKLAIILFLLPTLMFAQVIDDFSDGDFTLNPAWSGTTELYVVNSSFQLQTNGTAAGESYLSLPFAESGDVEWRFWLKQAFAPSANNFTDVYLVADNADLTAVTSGYYLRFGEAGSNDAIELFKIQNGAITSICRATDGSIAAPSQVSVKVKCDINGNWAVSADYSGGNNYADEVHGVDNTINRTGFFGIYSRYTASNATKIFFDNLYIGVPVVDLDPPQLLSIEVDGNSSLLLSFDEALSNETVSNTLNYTVDHGIGNPQSASLQGNTVILSFAESFESDVNYTLTLQGVADVSGNVISQTQKSFSIHTFSEGEVVVNEIMADPSPVVGLPEYEYIELFNATDLPISLAGCNLTIGSSANSFGDVTMEPGAYLLLCHNDAVSSLSSYGSCVGFESFAIANTSALITLSTADGTIISQVAFSASWYHDADKDDGGYSVEQIDPKSSCLGEINWHASDDPDGGTPGRINSIDNTIDVSPTITSVNMVANNILQLRFDQPMDLGSMQSSSYRVLENGVMPVLVNTNPNNATLVELVFAEPFEEGQQFTLEVSNLFNCKGTAMDNAELPFGIPSSINQGDIVINELLFNPIDGGVKYVELYNKTSYTFNVSDLRLGMIKTTFPNPADTTMKTITAEGRLFAPQSYLLLSTNSVIVGQQYECSIENYVDMASFPSYPTSGATVLLTDKTGNVIDRMDYSEGLHSPLLKETKGVSLERVSPDVESSNADLWHSAAENVHYGTPGRKNSMAQDTVITDNWVDVTPEVFSPDGDGFDDVCMINYNFDEPGYTLNVYIFNTGGQLVRHLAKGSVVGQKGSLPWNGFDDNGGRLPVGIYIMITEVYNFDGKVKKNKTPIVIMSR